MKTKQRTKSGDFADVMPPIDIAAIERLEKQQEEFNTAGLAPPTVVDEIKLKKGESYFTSGGKQIPYTERRISYLNLRLDPDNARLIPYFLSKPPGASQQATQEEVREAMWALETTRELYQDILQTGGLTEPLWVDTTGLVIEGNTRATCIWYICHNHPCLVKQHGFPRCHVIPVLSEKEKLTFLTPQHMTGKAPWARYAKAKKVEDMVSAGLTIKQIATMLHTTEKDVERDRKAFAATTAHIARQKTEGTKNPADKFTTYSYLFDNRELSKQVKEQPEFLNTVSDWINDGKIGHCVEVRKLPKILKDPGAKKVLTSPDGTVKKALAHLNNEGGNVFKRMAKLAADLANLSPKAVKSLKSDKVKKQAWDDLLAAVKTIKQDLAAGS